MTFSRIRDRVYGDFLMPSGLGSYRLLLQSALDAGYEIVPVARFWQLVVARTVDPKRRYLILRHDIDTDPRTGTEMWQIERTLGVTGSYYFRLSTLDLGLMSAIEREGGEASYHYEEIATLAKKYGLHDRERVLQRLPEAQDDFHRNLDKLRTMTGLPMRTVASHGDFANRRFGLPNWVILVDPRIRRLADIDLEVYDDAFVQCVSSRHSDTGYPRNWTPGDLTPSLDARLPIVYVLVHPRNWHARPAENARDDLRRLMQGAAYTLRRSSGSGAATPRELTLGSRPPEAGESGQQGSAAGQRPERQGGRPTFATSETPSSLHPKRALFLVRAPASYASERRYVLDVVLNEWLGVNYELRPGDKPGVSISLQGDARDAVLELPDVLFATPEADWLTERAMPSPPLARLSLDSHSLEIPDSTGMRIAQAPPVPVVFSEPGAEWKLFQKTSTGITFAADILGSVFYMLSRYEEVARRFLDEQDRYPSYASLAAIEGFLERPVVDEYVDALWVAMHEMWPTLTRPSTRFQLRLTHDVDQPWAAIGQPTTAVVRRVAGDLIRRRDMILAGHRAWSLLAARAGRYDGDPYNTFDLLMDTSERHGLTSTFYFLTGSGAGGTNEGYQLSDPEIRRLLRRIHDRGHEVGLHASYGSYQSPELVQDEFSALRAACDAVGFQQPSWGARQHYLRFEVPTTWRCHEIAGLDHDSTLGFADHIGFRAGTCREFPPYDLRARRKLQIREQPLMVMDRTLFAYQALGPDRAASRTRALVDTCRQHQGDATLLYHNDTLNGTRLQSHYQDLVKDLTRPT